MKVVAIITVFFLFILTVVVLHFDRRKEELVYFYHDQIRMEVTSIVRQYYWRDDDEFKKCLICKMYIYDKIIDDLDGMGLGKEKRAETNSLYGDFSLDPAELEKYCAPTENLACY